LGEGKRATAKFPKEMRCWKKKQGAAKKKQQRWSGSKNFKAKREDLMRI
jgi:hypothetical protein